MEILTKKGNKNHLAGKRILLLYARFFGYDQIVKEKLEKLGAIVDLYDARANINTFEKAIKKINAKYYYNKQRKFHYDIQDKERVNKYDFIFSNENIEVTTLKRYREIFPDAYMVLYLDDSVANMPGVEKTFSFYDKVLTFDRLDAEEYNIVFRPLFYSECFEECRKSEVTECKYDISFVGTCHSDRLYIIDSIKNSNSSLKFFLYCYLQSWFMYYYYYFNDKIYRKFSKNFFKYKQLSMTDVADYMNYSAIILDIQHPKQTGLTMRTIETLGLGKKIITTNKDIQNYDFFNENNVYIIDRKNPFISREFLEKDFKPLSEDIYYKYSLEGWIFKVFNKGE